jgi:hypothetical protein
VTALEAARPDLPAMPRMGETVQAKREDADEAFWSVTTLLGVLDKSDALINWACREQAKKTVDNLAKIRRRLEDDGRDGPEGAVSYVAGMRWWKEGTMLSDAALGTIAHHLFNEYAITGTRPAVTPDLHPEYGSKRTTLDKRDTVTLSRMLDQFDRFLQEWQPEYHATEFVVYSPTFRYAGQCDGNVSFDGVPTIIDYKTSRRTWSEAKEPKLRGPYPEVSLQLAAYRYAELAAVWRARRYESYSRRYYLLSPTELEMAVPVPPAERAAAIYVTPERYGVYPVRAERAADPDDPCDVREFEVFQHLIEVARWHLLASRSAVGNPAEPPYPIPPAGPADPFEGIPTE